MNADGRWKISRRGEKKERPMQVRHRGATKIIPGLQALRTQISNVVAATFLTVLAVQQAALHQIVNVVLCVQKGIDMDLIRTFQLRDMTEMQLAEEEKRRGVGKGSIVN